MSNALVFRLKGSEEVWSTIKDEGAPFSVRIGRGRECELAIPDSVQDGWTVSRVHARLFRHVAEYWVEDLRSRNLTYLNGRVVFSTTRFRVPCELRLGSVSVCVTRETVSSQDLKRSHPIPPVKAEAPPTRGLDQLELLDGKSQAILAQVRDELRWGAALQYLIEILSASRRAEEAELRLEQAFEVFLGANKACLGVDVPQEGIEGFLREASLGESAPSVAREITSGVAAGLTSPRRTEIPDSNVVVWVAESPGADGSRYSLLLASCALQTQSASEREIVDRVFDLILRTATPFIVALRGLEAQRACVTPPTEQLPSNEMRHACQEAEFWGESPPFLRMLYEAERAAVSYLKEREGRLPVLLFLGKSGVGKSTLARLVHRLSDHSKGPFVEVNCATIPANLAESELFGHEKGSFTGAEQQRQGLFERAGGGTLFLDEIGTMGASIQSKLLSVLDTGVFRRMGGSEALRTNCYVVLATNEEPEELVQQGTMREDLWYRIQTLTLALPPLRERLDDITTVVDRKFDSLNAQLAPPVPKRATERLKRILKSYSWPGNLRQLMEGIEAAYRLSPMDRESVDIDDLPPRLRSALGVPQPARRQPAASIDTGQTLAENTQRLEREYLVRLLAECGGVKTRAAARANISPQTLYNKLAEFRGWLRVAEGTMGAEEVAYLKGLAGSYWDMVVGE